MDELLGDLHEVCVFLSLSFPVFICFCLSVFVSAGSVLRRLRLEFNEVTLAKLPRKFPHICTFYFECVSRIRTDAGILCNVM